MHFQADYVWYCLPPRGRSGGILLGVNAAILDISMIVEGDFFIKFHLCNKLDNFKWILMEVYGPAQDNFKMTFLSELVRTCQQNPLPTLMGVNLILWGTTKRGTMIDIVTTGLFYSMLLLTALIFRKLSYLGVNSLRQTPYLPLLMKN
jgi:hypothetical protein